MSILLRGVDFNLMNRSMTRLECAEELKLIARLRSRMQKLERGGEPSRRFVAALSGKQGGFSQTDCRQE